ncbi:hypothetical protein BDM02DRAFT_3092654 [Thelephora ganbajun]|uniref:Uncharacterized protein n=1 Tax=Thelephora ganbajun TaxID=370292 RepID=A0ACB6ZML5_THEGA|nr:hypothetical protein BDM02DRAFT_3092654 [Thelephora ganbajun]
MHEGWVLKKRRKKMQGFARRYFTLYESGVLSYAFGPEESVRDQISLGQAAISNEPSRKEIHIDSGNATFHIRCLNSSDFEGWMSALRKYISADERVRNRRSLQRANSRLESLVRANSLVMDLSSTIHDLEEAISALPPDDSKKKSGNGLKSKERHGKEVFGLFRKLLSHPLSAAGSSVPEKDDVSVADSNAHARLHAALNTLKEQHAALARAVSSISYTDAPSTSLASSLVLPPRVDEGEEAFHTESPTSASASLFRSRSKRASVSTSTSDSLWFDAPEFDGGPEEFLLESTGADDHGPDGRVIDSGDREDSNSVDTDIEEQTPKHKSAELPSDPSRITRRTQLPSLPPADEGSLFAVLKKNVGKDLANVALPVTFNEPLSLLQRAAEELEYFDLLNQAAQSINPVDRMCYVAAFAVSGYAHTRFRSGRKGFNPMLGETFEDPRMRFIAEKVSHNPVIMAYHAEGEGWELWVTSAGRTKFWGKSLEIIPLGTIHAKIGGDHYQWWKPSSFMRNLMMGTKYLEHIGAMTIENVATDDRCILEFKESGYWGAVNAVSGTIYSASGRSLASIEGKWDENIVRTLDESRFQLLWKISPFPKNYKDYYGFTSFAITLNEITPDLQRRLPPTDSRYRPDVRALEEGDLNTAEAEKQRVEEAQRERRRNGKDQQPRWFHQEGDEWVYNGGYWEQREQGWKDVGPLW